MKHEITPSPSKADTSTDYTVGKTIPGAMTPSFTTSPKSTKPKRRLSKGKRVALLASMLLLVLIGGLGVYAARLWQGANTALAEGGSVLDLFISNVELEADSYGRTNVLLFGTSEDDVGHSGALLADSIMVLSVDQETYEANVISIPRDLWVQYNTDCSLGDSGKINASYYYALEAYNDVVDSAGQAFAEQVGEVIGTDIQYYVKVDYSALVSVVDTLGGD